MSTTTMAPQAAQPHPAFGFTFPQSNDNNPFIVDPVSLNAQQPFDDFGFDFTSFTNFDSLPNSTNVDSTFGADAFQQYLNDTHAPSLDESTSTPTSTALVSPKSSLSTFDANSPLAPTSSALGLSTLGPLPEESALPSNFDIEALSKHHLERFLHYKALADEAQRKAEVNALAQQQADSGAFQALVAPFDLNSGANAMNVGPMAPIAPGPMHSHLNAKGIDGSMLLSYAAPPSAGLAPAGSANAPRQSASFAYDPVMAQASMAQAQADAHLQAHTAAAARVQQQRMQTQYWVDSARSSFDQGHQHNQGQASASMSEPAWSRSSFSSSHGGSSYPSTPQYVAPPTMPLPAPVPSMPMSKTVLPPLVAPIGRGTSNAALMPLPLPPFTVASMPAPIPMMNAGVPPSMPMMPASMSSSARSSSSTESLQNQKPILNPHGGGRGYIPGKTPDDPKKRHKCDVCGRGFARAFNLKSHMATHDPDRSKPHMCPHHSCKRGFSRLHDLERHRQGIHNDGPLVDAKTHGVTPSVARAQVRSQKSSSSTSTTTAADTMSMSMSASVSGSASPEAYGYTGIGIANQPNLQPLQQ